MILPNFALIFIAPLLVYICYTDILYRKIYNSIIILLLVLCIIFALFTHSSLNIYAALITLIIGICLFYARIIGAGDIKLLAVLALSVPPTYIFDWLLLVALCGAVLVVIILICYYLLHIGRKTLPYGVAICSGYLILYWLA